MEENKAKVNEPEAEELFWVLQDELGDLLQDIWDEYPETTREEFEETLTKYIPKIIAGLEMPEQEEE